MTITRDLPEAGRRVGPVSIGVANVVRSEWTKVWSLRSTYWSIACAILGTVGVGGFMGARWAGQPANVLDGLDATNLTLSGTYLAQIVVGALGVLVISSEYTTGMIRATLAAVPQRRAVLAAKALVVAVTTFLAGEAGAFAAFGVGQAFLARTGFGASLGDPGVLRAVFGAGLYLAAVTLLGFGLGAAIRSTAGAVSAFFGVLFAPDVIVDLLPDRWRDDIINYLPANSGSQIFTTASTRGALPPWVGLGVFCLYAVTALAVAFALVNRRDA